MINPACQAMQDKYNNLLKSSKERSRADHRKAALDAANALRPQVEACMAEEGAGSAQFTPASNGVGDLVNWKLILGVVAVAGIGYFLYKKYKK